MIRRYRWRNSPETYPARGSIKFPALKDPALPDSPRPKNLYPGGNSTLETKLICSYNGPRRGMDIGPVTVEP